MSAENISYDLKRFAGIKRDYTPEDVERLRGSIKIEHSLCKHQSKKAHIQTLIDYSLLSGPSFSISKVCEILHINNVRSARKMIKELSLKRIGTTYNSRYSLKSLLKQQNAPHSEGAFVNFIILD